MHVSYIVFWVVYGIIFFFKQKTAYDVRISDGSSDVCSSDHPSDEDRVAPGGRGGERVDGIAHAGFMSINHAAMQVRGRRRDARSPANAAGAGCPYAVGSASKSAVIQPWRAASAARRSPPPTRQASSRRTRGGWGKGVSVRENRGGRRILKK